MRRKTPQQGPPEEEEAAGQFSKTGQRRKDENSNKDHTTARRESRYLIWRARAIAPGGRLYKYLSSDSAEAREIGAEVLWALAMGWGPSLDEVLFLKVTFARAHEAEGGGKSPRRNRNSAEAHHA